MKINRLKVAFLSLFIIGLSCFLPLMVMAQKEIKTIEWKSIGEVYIDTSSVKNPLPSDHFVVITFTGIDTLIYMYSDIHNMTSEELVKFGSMIEILRCTWDIFNDQILMRKIYAIIPKPCSKKSR